LQQTDHCGVLKQAVMVVGSSSVQLVGMNIVENVGNNRLMQTFIRFGLRLLGQLPLPVLHGIGWCFGQLLWWIPNHLVRVTQLHLARCFPQWPAALRRRVAYASVIESAKAVFEAPAIWFGSERRLRRWIGDAATIDAFMRIRETGQGAIWLTPHQGSWELAGQFVAQFGPMTTLYKPQKSPADAAILDGRCRLPTTTLVPTDTRGVKAVLSALNRRECVGILPDHDPPEGSGQFAPFFGIPAHTMDLVPKLAARSGAPVWFIVAERRTWGRGFRFHFLPAPANIADAGSGVAALNLGVEACVRLLPEQYWWSYKRFRRRPAGEPPFYG